MYEFKSSSMTFIIGYGEGTLLHARAGKLPMDGSFTFHPTKGLLSWVL